MTNIITLLQAYNTTDDVFQERGYGKNKVDLIKYLKTGDCLVFTSTNGARESIEKIPYEDMVKDLKKALIDSAIVNLVSPISDNKRLGNTIPDTISEWAADQLNGDMYISFDQLYYQILGNTKCLTNPCVNIIASLLQARRYSKTKVQLENENLTPELVELINILEAEKEKIDTKSKESNKR